MYCYKKIINDMYWVGGNDRRISLFENAFPVPGGVSYNAYLVLDEKTVLLDTVDKAISGVFFENVEELLGSRTLDYLIVNHMEPDHCATMQDIVLRYPQVQIICTAKAYGMIQQFFKFDIESRAIIVKESDTLETGKHTFQFYMAPMVHWPEAMVTYDITDKVLYSADAFGTFGAIGGNLFADELEFEGEWAAEARRYYTNIVGKYGVQVQALLKKAATLDIAYLCPLHGPIWRENIGWYVDKYLKWSSYTPEEQSVVVIYGSIYGNTENAAQILAMKLGEKGVRNVKMYDVSAVHPSYLLSEVFRVSHLVFASITYNGGIFSNMEAFLHELLAHNVQNRTVALIENGTWGVMSGKLMTETLSKCKNITLLENKITVKSSLKDEQMSQLEQLADEIIADMNK